MPVEIIKYYCTHCEKEVEPIKWKFQHPHLGIVEGKVCPDCARPVMIKD